MTSSISSAADFPTWDTHTTSTISTRTAPVPDDWDADEDEEESAKDIWDRANASAPMPDIQISSSAQSTTILPPVSAIMPSMRILQRPKSNSPSQSSPSPTPSGTKTMKEREAEYKAARNRIFAGEDVGASGSGSSSREGSPAPRRGILTRGGGRGGHTQRKGNSVEGGPSAKTTREPLGPTQEGSRGFAARGRRGRGGGPVQNS